MCNLENARDLLHTSKRLNRTDNIYVEYDIAWKAIDLANKTEWKHLEKNEFPNTNQLVLGISKNGNYHLVKYISEFKEFYKDDDFAVKIIQWCELPIFNKA